jgi:hypothetical protein
MTDVRDLRDDDLVAALAAGWQSRDPVPADLGERMVFTVALASLEEEVELLQLVGADDVCAGTRADDPARVLTFSTDRLTMMVTISERPGDRVRIDGWIDPPAPGEVILRYDGRDTRHSDVDDEGRFALDDLTAGMVRLSFRAATDDRTVAAPVFHL